MAPAIAVLNVSQFVLRDIQAPSFLIFLWGFYHFYSFLSHLLLVEATRLRTFRCWFSWALDLPSERVFYNKGIFVVAGVPRQWMAMVLVVQHHRRIRDPLNLLVTVSSLVLGLQRFTVQLQGIEVSWLWPRQLGMLRLQICIHNQYKQYTYYNITVQNVTRR